MKISEKGYWIEEREPEFAVSTEKPIPLAPLMASASLALGETYMDGDLEIEGNLYYALDHFLRRMDKFSTNKSTPEKLVHLPATKHNQQKKVQSRYNTGNDFYKLWLDETMSYSHGYSLHPDDTFFQAQVNKVNYILRRLYLERGISLLDVGCRWGFLLIGMAKKYGVQEMGITLSREQYREVKRRVVAEHLEEPVTVKLTDYQDLSKCRRKFDRTTNVGVVEHVGRNRYQLLIDYGKKVLKPGRLSLLHSINGLKEHTGNPWIEKYIFQGRMAPSLGGILACAAEDRFHTLDTGNFRPHYNRVLLYQERNYREHLNEVRSMSDERFVGMWDLYLSACAATFHSRIIDLHQTLFLEGTDNQLPLMKRYQNGNR